MSWKNTWILVGLSGALFAFIALVERRFDPTGTVPEPKPLFASFKPTAATAIQIRRGSQYVINLERTSGGWAFAKKFSYPAAAFPVQSFLEQLERAVPATRISAREILAFLMPSCVARLRWRLMRNPLSALRRPMSSIDTMTRCCYASCHCVIGMLYFSRVP